MLKIDSYRGVNGVPFGASKDAVEATLGAASNCYYNSSNEEILSYEGFVARLEARTGTLREVSLLAEVEASINGEVVGWDGTFLDWLSTHDSRLLLSGGIVVSLKLGIAITGFGIAEDDSCDRCITAFQEGDWDIFHSTMRPFRRA